MRRLSGAVWVGQVEIGSSFLPSGASRERRRDDIGARLLVRLHSRVLGFVSVPLTAGQELTGPAVAAVIRAQLGRSLACHLEADGLPSDDPGAWSTQEVWDGCRERLRPQATPELSVVVCTRDRPELLARCLEQLQKLEYGPFEVVVVDNAPSTEASRSCFSRTVGDDVRFRYVRETEPGLSRARNRGMAEATARWVAFTDDDVRVDPGWLQGIAAGFARDQRAGCLTGLVAPAELDHPAQEYFDRRFSWGRRTDPCVYSLASRDLRSSLFPYSAGLFGTGANFAVDGDLMRSLGGFDEALGAGSPAGGGEELDAFVRILRAGRSIIYEPSAVVWHFHRADPRALRKQLFTYGEGLTAFLTKHLLDSATTKEILQRVPEGGRQVLRMWSPGAINGRAPTGFILVEALGMAAGPLAYFRGSTPRGRSLRRLTR